MNIEWIDVKDDKPTCSRSLDALGTEVLIWPRDDGQVGATAFYGRRATGRPNFYKYGAVIDGITHWSYLPGGPSLGRGFADETSDRFAECYDAFSIGSAVRSPQVLLANIENASRRSNCLSAIEREFFTYTVKDENDEDMDRCSLNWGADPEEYVEQFRKALADRHAEETPALTNDQCQRVVGCLQEQEWSGISNDDVRLWDGLIQNARLAVKASERPCTCHPDDNPPRPCPGKYALTECRKAAAYREEVNRVSLACAEASAVIRRENGTGERT